jgi:hypothetical protein
MPTTSLLSDEMLRQLIAVGQVDIAVGIPTLNHAGAIVDIVDAVTSCFRTHFPHERAVLVNVDGGSDDGTPELVLDPARAPRNGPATGGLRTIHRISARYPGLVSRTKSVQVAFGANELVRARALAIIDPDCSVSADSVAALLRPVLREPCDFVAPIYDRAWCEGSLVTQLLRPAVRGIYRKGLAEPAAGEWACSSRFASDALPGPLWDVELGPAGVSLWMAATALVGSYETRQVGLGLRPTPLRSMRAALPEVFAQVVGALFRSVELHEAYWRENRDVVEVPVVHSLADATEAGPPFADELWATVVYEFAAAFHRGSIHRDHLIQALVTPYLGRTAAFLAAHTATSPTDATDALQALGLEFERAQPVFVECWNRGGTT